MDYPAHSHNTPSDISSQKQWKKYGEGYKPKKFINVIMDIIPRSHELPVEGS